MPRSWSSRNSTKRLTASRGRSVSFNPRCRSIPAHNELRYAGHHLLQAINDDGTIADDGQILKAKNHCERAMYEAAEAGIISALDLMHIFRTDNKGVVVGEVVPGYSQMRKLARTAQDLLVKGRSGRISAVQQVRSYMDVFRALRDARIRLAGRHGLKSA